VRPDNDLHERSDMLYWTDVSFFELCDDGKRQSHASTTNNNRIEFKKYGKNTTKNKKKEMLR
jgi:hypothetical protein